MINIKKLKSLLKKTNTEASEIDLIICATVTPDMVFPATACIIADSVGATNAFGFDVSAACSGFLFALKTGSSYIESGFCKKVVVIGSDKMSSIIDYEDRQTCVIFGDGAGAVLLEPTTEDLGIKDAVLKVDGSGKEYLKMNAGGSLNPPSFETVKNKQHYVHQDGKVVFKFAVSRMADVAAEIMEKNKLFFNRWRPQNETYLHGFRKHEQGNNAKEIPQFDPLVANKDKKIQEIALSLSAK